MGVVVVVVVVVVVWRHSLTVCEWGMELLTF